MASKANILVSSIQFENYSPPKIILQEKNYKQNQMKIFQHISPLGVFILPNMLTNDRYGEQFVFPLNVFFESHSLKQASIVKIFLTLPNLSLREKYIKTTLWFRGIYISTFHTFADVCRPLLEARRSVTVAEFPFRLAKLSPFSAILALSERSVSPFTLVTVE